MDEEYLMNQRAILLTYQNPMHKHIRQLSRIYFTVTNSDYDFINWWFGKYVVWWRERHGELGSENQCMLAYQNYEQARTALVNSIHRARYPRPRAIDNSRGLIRQCGRKWITLTYYGKQANAIKRWYE